jgi:magnesium and cobalt transporter
MSSDSPTGFSWFQRLTQLLSNEPQDREQLLNWLREAQQRNLFSAETLNMIEGALQVSEMPVRDVMIPRAQMIVLPYDGRLEDLLEIVVDSGHSRFPVIDDSRDDIQGILLAKDLLSFSARGGRDFAIRDLLRPAMFIPESKRLNVLLREFRASRNHLAIVIDEYAGAAGLVTIEDVIEQIVGDIDDEHDIDEEIYIRPRERGYTVRALTPIEEFNAYFHCAFSDEEFDTIGGTLLKAFGHLPKRGEKLELNGFSFEVLRSDNRRIHVLRVKPPQSPTDSDNHV